MLRRVGIVLVFALAALVPTGRFVTTEVPAPVQWVQVNAPWNGEPPAQAYDILGMDAALQFLPWRHFMLEAYRAGHVPLWNPYTLGGTPFLANSQSAPMYPLHWLWRFDAESLLGFSAWIHLALSGLGVFALCRRLGSSTVGGLVAGVALQFSAFFISWLPLPSVLMTASWIPWCLWAVLLVAQSESKLRPVGALGLCSGMMLLAGHLQIAALGVLATVGFVGWLVLFPPEARRRTCALWALAGMGLGSMLAAPQLLPALENGRQGHRAAAPSAEGWQAYKGSAATTTELVTLFSPDFYGTPQPVNEATGATSYWLAYTKPGRHYAEIAFYVAPAILPLAALAFVGIRKRPEAAYLGVLALLGLLIALGTPVAQALYFFLPGWSATGSPARAAVLVVLSLCVLAGLGLREEADKRQVVGLVPALFGLALFAAALATIPADVAEVFPSPSWMWPVAVFACGIGLMMPLPRVRLMVAGAGCLVGVIPLLGMTPSAPRGLYAAEFPGVTALQNAGRVAVVGEDWPFLSPSTDTPAPPNSLLPYEVAQVGGYDSLIRARYKAALDDANGEDSAPPSNGNLLLVKPGADLEKLRALGAKALMASDAHAFDLPMLYEGEGWTLYDLEDDAESFLYWESYNHKILRWHGRFRDESRAWLHMPEADGWEMHPVSYDFAQQTVVSVYRPHGYRVGFLLGMLGITATIALSFGGGRSSRAGNRNEDDRDD